MKSWINRELKKLKNLMVTMSKIVIGTIQTVIKSEEKRLDNLKIRGRIITIYILELLKSSRILGTVLEVG